MRNVHVQIELARFNQPHNRQGKYRFADGGRLKERLVVDFVWEARRAAAETPRPFDLKIVDHRDAHARRMVVSHAVGQAVRRSKLTRQPGSGPQIAKDSIETRINPLGHN
jgi:hypothetical protein